MGSTFDMTGIHMGFLTSTDNALSKIEWASMERFTCTSATYVLTIFPLIVVLDVHLPVQWIRNMNGAYY